jgi:hypothetical protein
MFRRFFLTAMVAVAAALAAPAVSRADFTLSLAVGSTTGLIDFTNPGSSSGSISGLTVTNLGGDQWTVSGSFAGYFLKINTDDFTASPTLAEVENDTSRVYNTSGGALGDLTMTLSQTYTPTISGVAVTAKDNVTVDQVVGTSTAFVSGTTNMIGTQATTAGTVTVNASDVNGSGHPFVNTTTNATSLTLSSVIVIDGLTSSPSPVGTNYDQFTIISSVTSNGSPFIVTTPAPAGLILAATMVPFFGLLRKRLRKMGAETTVVA